MYGILIIDKPEGITSHDVVARIRRILGTRRVGHTGTLDPFATGVMVTLVGKATRLAQYLDKDEKEYEAAVRFGFETDTGDRTGLPRTGSEIENHDGLVTIGELDAVLPRFLGEIEQVPPMYSAKKIDGGKLYESARKGIEVERQPVKITIREIEIIGLDEAADAASLIEALRIRVVCSAGTYVRTLAEDIARSAGGRAHLAELRRTRSGRFDLSISHTLDGLAEMENPRLALLPIETAVSHLTSVTLNADRAEKTRNGLSTRVFDMGFVDEQPIVLRNEQRKLIAVGVYVEAQNSIRPKVVLV